MQPYDYSHRQGVRPISWDDFAALAATLAEQLAPVGIELVVGIARAGLIPATTIACSLRREMYPVRITRRVNDEVRYTVPVWKVPVTPDVAGKVVAVIDEIADTGQTLDMVAARVRELGAAQVVTACLVRHSWANTVPTFCALVSDALVVFPWNRRALIAGQWQLHPEVAAALKLQGKESLPGD